MSTPGEIRVGHGKSISLAQAQDLGLRPCIERMLNFTEHLRRLRVDEYEYVAMKVIVLVTSGECLFSNSDDDASIVVLFMIHSIHVKYCTYYRCK